MWGVIRNNLQRLQKLLVMPEDYERPSSVGKPGELDVSNASFAWGGGDAGSSAPILSGVNMHIEPGSLVAVVGAVASGKSTLAGGILSLVQATEGRVRVGGTTALCAQQPFVMNESVKQNIVFEAPFDQALYNKALHACCLETDLAVFPNGDETEVGEKGVTISGSCCALNWDAMRSRPC